MVLLVLKKATMPMQKTCSGGRIWDFLYSENSDLGLSRLFGWDLSRFDPVRIRIF
jgi:hypothetical protein